MIKVLDMKFIRYANIFGKVTRIRCSHCFEYNNAIVFAIPRKFVMRAIGKDNINLEKISRMIGKRVKIVAIPNGVEDIESFVSMITRPVRFKGIEVKDGEAIISAGSQSKASLIGKNRIRLNEMQNILEQYFNVKRVRIK
jgi:transcription antitermination factor NusA-like protein